MDNGVDNKKSPDIVVIIPARKNSRRLPHKNTLTIGNLTLVERAFFTCKKALGHQADIFVFTDINENNFVRLRGECLLPRSADMAGPMIPLQDSVRYALGLLPKKYKTVIILMPNCPFVEFHDVRQALGRFRMNRSTILRTYDSETGRENGLIIVDYDYFMSKWIDIYASAYMIDGFEIHDRNDYDIAVEMLEQQLED